MPEEELLDFSTLGKSPESNGKSTNKDSSEEPQEALDFRKAIEEGTLKPSDTPASVGGQFTGFGTLPEEAGQMPSLIKKAEPHYARNQKFWAELGLTTTNLLPNVGLGLLESAGYLGELGHYGISELLGKEYRTDFSNALTEWAKKKKDPAGKVYRKDRSDITDFSDSAWWFQTGAGLAESIAQFYAVGAGAGALTRSAFGGLARAINASSKGLRTAANVGAQATTAATLGYTEGAISASEVYKKAIQNGNTPEEAATAASTTAKANTALIGALSMTSVLPLFKSNNALLRANRYGLTRKSGESVDDFVTRLKQFTESPEIKRTFFQKYQIPLESAQESVEELSNLAAEALGKQEVGMEDPDKNFFELFTEKTFSEEGALNAVLGAIGGAAQVYGLRKLPLHTRQETEEGETKTRRLSADELEQIQTEQMATSYAKRLTDDITEVQELNKKLKEASERKDEAAMNRYKNELFNVAMRRSIFIDEGMTAKDLLSMVSQGIDNETDMGDRVRQQIESLEGERQQQVQMGNNERVAQIDQEITQLEQRLPELEGKTQAMMMGIAEEPGDDSVEKLVQEKSDLIDKYLKRYEELINEYGLADERSVELAEYVMDLEVKMDTLKSDIEKAEGTLQDMVNDVEEENRAIFGEDHPAGFRELFTKRNRLVGLMRILKQNLQDAQKVDKVRGIKQAKKLWDRLPDVEGEIDNNSVEYLKKKYNVRTLTELRKTLNKKINRTRDLVKQVESEVDELASEATDAEGDVFEKLDKLPPELARVAFKNERLENYQREVEDARGTLQQINDRHNTITSAGGPEQFIERAFEDYQEQKKKREQRKAESEAVKKKAQDKEQQENIKDRKKEQQKTKKEETEEQTLEQQIRNTSSLEELDAIVEENELTPEQQDVVAQRRVVLEPLSEEEQEVDEAVEQSEVSSFEDGDTTTATRSPAGLQEEYSEVVVSSNEGSLDPDNLKVTDSNKLQFLSTDYIEVVKDTPSGLKVVRFTSANGPRSEFDRRIESDRYLQPGEELLLVPDTEFAGQRYDENGELVDTTFTEIMESEGVENAPVRVQIVREDQRIDIGYLPETNWVAKKDKFGNPKNIAEETSGNPDNYETQIARIKKIREAIFEEFSNTGEGIRTKVESKSPGFLRFNYATDSEGNVRQSSNGKAVVESKYASELLPDPDLKFAVMRQGVLSLSTNHTQQEEEILEGLSNRDFAEENYNDGMVFAVMGDRVVPVHTNTLRQEYADTVWKAILAKHEDNKDLIEAIDNVTFRDPSSPFSFKSSEGLARLLSRYAFSRSFTPDIFQKELDSDLIHFHVNDRGHVDIARHGDGVIYTTDTAKIDREPESYRSMLDVDNRKFVREHISNIRFSVRFNDLSKGKLLNSSNQMRRIVIDENDSVQHQDMPYNEYVKTNILTHINGTVTYNHGTENDPDIEYLYQFNPVVRFDDTFANPQPAAGSEAEVQTTNVTEPERGRTLDSMLEEAEVPQQEESEYDTEEDLPTLEDEEGDLDFFAQSSENFMEQSAVDSELKEALSKYAIGEFTPEQVADVVDSMVYVFSKRFNEGDSLSEARDYLRRTYLGQRKRHQSRGESYFVKQYEDILDNWERFEERALSKLKVLGIKVTPSEDYEGEESNYERTKYDKKAQWFEDRKNTASANLKLFLATIEDVQYVTEDGEQKIKVRRNFLNRKKFMPFDVIYDELNALFADQRPSLDNYLSILDEAASSNPYFKVISERLKKLGNDDTLHNEFVVAMSSQYLDFSLVFTSQQTNKEGEVIGYNVNVGSSNRQSAIARIYDEWVNNMKESDLVREEDGDLIINRKQAQDIKQQYINRIDKINDSKVPTGEKIARATEEFRWLLKQIGVTISDQTFNEIVYRAKRKRMFLGQSSSLANAISVRDSKGRLLRNNFIGILFRNLGTDISEDQERRFSIGNPLENGSLRSRFRSLAATEFKYSPRIYSSSLNNVDGKTIYSHQMNTLMSKLFRDMDSEDSNYMEEVANTPFGSKSHWYNSAQEGKDKPTLHYADGIKPRNSSSGTLAENMGEVDWDIFSLGLFHSKAAHTQGERAMFMSNIKSDKSALPIIEAPRVDTVIDIDEDSGEVKRIANKELYNIALSEANRIYSYQRQNGLRTQMLQDGRLMEDYDQGANYFHTFPFLNLEYLRRLEEAGEVTQQQIDAIWVEEKNPNDPEELLQKIRNNPEAKQAIQQIVEDQMIKAISEHRADLQERGVLMADESGNSFIDYNYLRNVSKYTDKQNQITYAIADYLINKAVASNEEMKYVSGDPAFYWKGGDSLFASLTNTKSNWQKRGARDVGPRSDNNWSDRYLRRIVLDDEQFTSSDANLPEAYHKPFEPTDAQEFTTLEEHLKTMVAWGKISQSRMDEFMSKHGKGTPFTGEELDVILQPQKPLYSFNKTDKGYGLNIPLYVKSSSFPLIPQFTQGNKDIDKLRRLMEKYNIDRASFVSANKSGITNTLNLYSDEGGYKSYEQIEDDFNRQDNLVEELPRAGLGLQQEIPVKDKTEVTLVTQMNKQLFEGLRDIEGFSFEGKPYKGRALEQQKEETLKAMIQRSRRRLYDSLGVRLSDGTLRVDNFERLKNVLVREAETRDWPISDIEALQLTEDKTEFVVPFYMGSSASKIESLVLSMVSKVVTGQKIYGKSFVQGTSSGLQVQEDIAQSDLDQVVTTEEYNPEEGLKFVSKEDGEVTPAQIFIPWNFTDNNGKLLDINNFTKTSENGRTVIDYDKLPKDILKTIGARIPNQGHNSMLPVEIAGFLPAEMGDLAIVPKEIVVQMGSDFDVDKLYTYLSQFYYDEGTGTLHRMQLFVDNHDRLYEQLYGIITRNKKQINQIIADLKPDEQLIGKIYNSLEIEEEVPLGNKIGMEMVLEEFQLENGTYRPLDNIPSKDTFLKQASRGVSRVLPRKALQQRFMDVHWSVLTHPEVFDKVVSPLDKDDLQRMLSDIQTELGLESLIPSSPLLHSSQREDRMDLKEGKDLIGIFALGLNFSSIAQDRERYNLHLQGYNSETNTKYPEGYTFLSGGDREVEVTTLSGQGTTRFKGEKRTKHQNVSILLSAAVDNANEGVLGPLNINRITAPVALAMSLMESEGTAVGSEAIPLSYTTTFLSQPAIKQYVQNYRQLQSATRQDFVSNVSGEALAKTKAQIKDRMNDPELESSTTTFSEQDLRLMLSEEASDDLWSRQLEILNHWEKLSGFAEDLTSINRYLLGPTTSGAGTTVPDLMANLSGIEHILNSQFSIANAGELLGTKPKEGTDGRVLSFDTELGEMIKSTVYLGKAIFREISPYFDEEVQNMFSMHQYTIGKPNLNAKDYREVWNATISSINSHHADLLGDRSIDEYFEELLFSKDNSIAHQVRQAQRTWGQDNFFLQRLEPQISESPGAEPSTVSYRGSKGLRLDDSENLIALSALYTSPDTQVRELATNLTAYALLFQGRQTPSGFMRYIPVPLLEHLGIAERMRGVQFGRQTDEGSINLDSYEVTRQLYQHKPYLTTRISEEEMDKVEKQGKVVTKFVLSDPAESRQSKGHLVRFSNGAFEFAPFFHMQDQQGRWRLYERVESTPDASSYVEIDVLGWKSQVNEYQPTSIGVNSDYTETRFPENKSVSGPAMKSPKLKKQPEKQRKQENKAVGDNLLESRLGGTLNDTLQNINSSDYAQSLSQLLVSKLEEEGVEIPVERTGNIGSIGFYSTGKDTLFIREEIGDSLTDMEHVDRFLLHEAVHAVTAEMIKQYERGDLDPNSKEAEQVRALEHVYNTVINRLITDEKVEEFEQFKKDFKEWNKGDREESIPFHPLYYPLMNMREFVAYALTDRQFQIRLNKIQVNSKQTVWERILDVLSKLTAAIGRSMGITVKVGSALESTIASVVAFKPTVQETEVDYIKASNDQTSKAYYDTLDSISLEEFNAVLEHKNRRANTIEDAKKWAADYYDWLFDGPHSQSIRNVQDNLTEQGISKNMSITLQNYGGNEQAAEADMALYKRIAKGIVDQVRPKDQAESQSRSLNDMLDDIDPFGQAYEEVSHEISAQVESLDFRISRVKINITKAKGDAQKRQRLKEHLESLKEDKQLLLDQANSKAVKTVAERQLEWAKSVGRKRRASVTELYSALSIADSWDFEHTINFLPESAQANVSRSKIAGVYSDIGGEAGKIRKELLNSIGRLIRDRINEQVPKDQRITLSDVMSTEDVGTMRSWFMDLSTFDNKLASHIDALMKDASRAVAVQIENIREDLEKYRKEFGSDIEFMFQKDEDGNLTGNLIDIYSQSYRNDRRAAYIELTTSLQRADQMSGKSKKRTISNAFEMYHNKTTKMEHAIDVRFFVIDGFGSEEFKNRAAYEEYLRGDIENDEHVDQLIKKAKQQYDQFLQDLESYRVQLEGDLAELTDKELGRKEDETDEEYIERKVEQWKLEHSPIRHLDEKYKDNVPIREYVNRYGSDYVVTAARRRFKGDKTGYYDSRYEQLTDKQKEFHRYTMSLMNQMLSYLPNYLTRNIDENFMPKIKADLMEAFQQDGMAATLQYMKEDAFDSITGSAAELNRENIDPSEIDPKTGRPRKSIPTMFLGDNPRGTADDPFKGVSKNLFRVLDAFSKMAINYRYKSHVEDEVNLAYRLLQEASEKAQEGGKLKKDRRGKYMKYTDGLVSMTESVKYAIDAMLYGNIRERKESPIKLFGTIRGHKEKAARAKEIERERDQLELKYDREDISKDAYDTQMAELEEEYKALGGKNLVWSKVADKVLYYTQLKGMGFNLTAGIANIGFGLISNFTWSASKKDFTDLDLLKASRIILSAAVKGRATKAAKFIHRMDLLFEVSETEYGKQIDSPSTSNKTFEFIKSTPYGIQRRTEFVVQGMSAVAKAMNQQVQVETLDGETKEISLYEALDENGKWDTSKYKENPDWKLDVEPGESNKMTKFRNSTIQLNKYLHGNYDPNSRIRIKNSTLGLFLMQFRSWIPFGFAQRFSGEYYDRQLGDTFKGRYRTFSDIGLKKSLKGMFGQYFGEELAFGKKGADERLSDQDIANLKMNLREMHVLLTLISMGVLTKMALQGEDEEDAVVQTGMILFNQLYRVEQDIYFYLSPGTFEDIIRNPIAVMRTYTDFRKAVDSSVSYVMDSEYKGTAPSKNWGKAVPLVNQFIKTQYLAQNDMSD